MLRSYWKVFQNNIEFYFFGAPWGSKRGVGDIAPLVVVVGRTAEKQEKKAGARSRFFISAHTIAAAQQIEPKKKKRKKKREDNTHKTSKGYSQGKNRSGRTSPAPFLHKTPKTKNDKRKTT